ncbi:DNA-directed RNA polymerase I subunit RPA2 [Ophidiomyces ophidiicola]|uniref:DNA-directed RNA polymerase I subunit RPA2 n=1 Tax=Ophidiomyces ophidiicola TaxID=1387563 RepID=A0ACB8UST9_9EURO|nr:DNA-directed RNA polymerase I subunit RPA2 [Ophidiomyces ophidiicola]KAI1921534.1 DNA-directed RNA polymerase I subunit RPA2 [Ophidiomyces ophidiicola]KAI1937783.1 DNA-directed RNA polymerase I subunit RPA2 [Ophidiomyces ophidiicola]KAI1948980.1 DNA-directed RNA polymerase I subunit RPA2 [Ophidiomyces ophidiicola]KAI1958679.1 DNA-directed RNA polymerase I subunit RPA2 [Ophidiomyces ophidiicola]KAI1970221.1 DNA-directed RNA polymerase I subunit RPA2 [Ophidiomyces ophidiicola]
MMSPATSRTKTDWNVQYDTIRREHLSRHPPKDHTAYPMLAAAVRPHIDSFNALFDDTKTMQVALHDIGTKTFLDGVEETMELRRARGEEGKRPPKRNKLSIRITELFLEKAVLPASNKFSTRNREIFPAECRERHATYRGKLRARLEYRVNNGDWKESVRELGQAPIMLRTNRCHLENFTPCQLVQRKEESEELGGYFIVNGNEKLIRMLIVSRRNYPMAIIRNSFTKRGTAYTKYGVQIRSVRPDQTSQTNVLHYLSDGNVTFRFSWRKNEYLVPVIMILKALVETNDREIFERLVGREGSLGMKNTFVTDRVELLLRTYKAYSMNSKSKCRAYLGEKFRYVLGMADSIPNEAVGTEFLRKIVLPHLGNQNVTEPQDNDKYSLILFMIRKLYALVGGDCAPDNPDAVSNQEVLLGGFLYGMILKERLEEWLRSIGPITRDWINRSSGTPFTDQRFEREFLSRIIARTNENIGSALEYFLSTGNLVSPTGLDLQQPSGYTIIAEKINFYRFISHFRMIHRGSFFAQLKTTTVRKLLPESWGFLCPVHTPDGSPCGLLNHLAHKCLVATSNLDVSGVPDVLSTLGVGPDSSSSIDESIAVVLDGRILGYCSPKQGRVIADTLRHWKVEGHAKLPTELEIGYIPNSNGGQYPGVYLFSQSARMYRPVKYLPLDKLDYVGPFEQPFMEIACLPAEIESGVSTHVEFDPTHILSILANMTPFSDFNQSPRNMYQCQMAKQAMGTPGTSIDYRTDNKLYKLQTGQTPVVRPPLYNAYGLDNFPNGMNAVVAVISYTGYDMDDAMIINKSAHERGFGYGTIYKTKVYSLDNKESRGNRAKSRKEITKLFGFAPGGLIKAEWRNQLDEDGLPHIGGKVGEGDIIAAWHTVQYDPAANTYLNVDKQTHFLKYKDSEAGYIDSIRILGAETGGEPCQAISVKYRIPRKPVIGDKFSSRHGQKGVCSQLWPAVDMPFSESGMQPDVIINPHAFPSRMTIGMFVESLAGKAGALHGLAQDSTPFQFSEEYTAGNYFGEQLRKAGYNFHGNEPMYSGVTGREFAADIYIGVVYYQRLRHMVNDKFQVRTTGPVNALTGQPIKGRAKGGGIRVGEMERDALLAHGAAFLLQDRLMNCSDSTRAWICRTCGSFLSTQVAVSQMLSPHRNPAMEAVVKTSSTAVARPTGGVSALGGQAGIVRCRRCAREAVFDDPRAEVWEDGSGGRFTGGDNTTVVAVPGVLKYLDVELAAMGVRMKFRVDN